MRAIEKLVIIFNKLYINKKGKESHVIFYKKFNLSNYSKQSIF